jgi:hypothetical protein
VNLKYNYPAIVLALILSAALFFSIKRDSSEPREKIATSEQELQDLNEHHQDQITLSAMHAEPAPTQPAAQPALGAASAADLAKLQILKEVLANQNDNDPRLDKELRDLSPSAKALMRGQYEATRAEKRNQRGTIVYLVGRELSSPEDVGFLRTVLNEPPCLSMADCARESRGSVAPNEHHLDSASETTLAYPQIVALKSIEAFLNRPDSASNPLSPQLLTELEAAKRSPIRKIAALAESISQRYADRRR